MAILSVAMRIKALDRRLVTLVGLMSDPQARQAADELLDQRCELMLVRDLGYRMRDRRVIQS